MSKAGTAPHLAALGLQGVDVKAAYRTDKGEERTHRATSIRISPYQMFIEWRNAPKDLEELLVVWAQNPFLPGPFRCRCQVLERRADGLLVEFEGPVPAPLKSWFEKASLLLGQQVPDAAVRTSRLYTMATVVSATGLFCGALAILLPILAGDQEWVDGAAKILLLLMVCSIGGFAWLRALAGRAEVRAIAEGQA